MYAISLDDNESKYHVVRSFAVRQAPISFIPVLAAMVLCSGSPIRTHEIICSRPRVRHEHFCQTCLHKQGLA